MAGDPSSSSFVHLSVRSYFSIKDGAFSPEDLAVRAAELGMPAVAVTDRDGLYGAPRFAAACARVGVRPIFGAALTVRTRGAGDGPPRDRRVSLLAKNATGYGNLCRLITTAHMTGERGDPALTTGQICERASGLVCLLGPESEPGSLAARGLHDAAVAALHPYRAAFGPGATSDGGDLFLEIQHRMEPGSVGEVRRVLRLAEDMGLPAVATNGVRYLVPGDAFLADVLECMREIVPLASHHVSRKNAEGYLKSADEMRALFEQRPDLCDRTLDIAERCEFDLGLGQVHFPEFPTPAGRSAGSVLAERCWRGLRDRGMRPTREVRDRLDRELAQIQMMGYAAYFLTVADIVDDIRAMGIRCACRGSAAGSLVCYLTRVSDVDPVRHGLLFERFINPLRDELPDVDIDVESARRKEVYDAVLSRYGDDRCSCVTMIDTYRARGAIREVGKALGFPEGEVDLAAKAFPHIGAQHVREAMDRLPELEGLNLDAGQLEMLFRVVERLNGFPRHLALHPSGIVLSGHDLPDRVPLERSFEGYRMVQADKDDVELLGLLKLDVLGIRMLSAMRHCLDEIARTEGEKVELDDIALRDPATFELIRSSDTLGCFQIESPGQRELLQKYQPTEWADLIIDISLFRPGPVKSDMVSPFLNRRHGVEAATYVHPLLKPVLEESHGVVVYHEQLIRVISVMTGYDLSTADKIRRHLNDDEHIDAIHQDFVTRAVRRGVGPEDAERVWKEVVAFASFGFCKAHAAAFAVPTYQSAWLKAHYPAHFLAGVLTHEPGMYPRRLILEDARRHGIAILPLDVNLSEPNYTVEVVSEGSSSGGGLRWRVPDGRVPPLPLAERSPSTERSPLPSSLRGSPDHRLPLLGGDGHRGTTTVSLGPGPHWLVLDSDQSGPGPSEIDGSPPWEATSIRGQRGSGGPRSERGGGGAAPNGDRSANGSGGTRPSRTAQRRSNSSVEPTLVAAPPEVATQAPTYGIRLGLKDVHGISDDEIDSILDARVERPFVDVGDVLRRTRLTRPVAEALAHAGAFDSLPGGSRRDRLFAAMVTDAPREGEQAPLPLGQEIPSAVLREYTSAERVRAELEVVGMDASRHLVSFYRPVLKDLGVTWARDLGDLRGDVWVMVAGVKVASQTPAVRSGQRIIFLTLDDGTGLADVTVFERVQPWCAKTVFHGFVLAVWGRLRRTGVRGVSVVAEQVWDVVALSRARREGRLAEMLAATQSGTPAPLAARATASITKVWHASGGSAGR
jgi:error-prone DNA polymerase